MNKSFKEIVGKILEKYPNKKFVESEHFLYWFLEEKYNYGGVKVSKEEYEQIKNYVVKYHTTPLVENRKVLMDEKKLKDNNSYTYLKQSPEYKNDTNSSTLVLRYSKTHQSLEMYKFYTEIRSRFGYKDRGIIILKKRCKYFTINKNLFTRFKVDDKTFRWLSFKNIDRFHNCFNHMLTQDAIKIFFYNTIKKDWVNKLFLRNSYYIENKIARKANSFDEAILLSCGVKPSKSIVMFFEDDINQVIGLYSVIDSNKIHYLTNFIKKHYKILEELSVKSYFDLLFYYFLAKDNRCEYQIIFDYLNMLRKNKMKINLAISSYSTIKRKHDELSKYILSKTSKKGRLGVKRFFPNIKPVKGIEVEKITTIDRLNKESQILHHCVHSYSDTIKQGGCAIYSIIFKENRYTLQLNRKKSKDKEGNDVNEFYISQLRGLFNCLPPSEIKPYIDELCTVNNISYENFINFNERKENKKIIQIGDKILYNIKNGVIKRVYEGSESVENNEDVYFPF